VGKVSIIGSGNVGANTAFFIAEKGITDVYLYDIQEGLSTGKALDMMEAAPLRRYRNRIIGIDHIEDISDSESVVIAAGNACTIGRKPEELLQENMETVTGIVEKIVNISPGSIIIMATEPVDIITAMTAQRFALSRNKILGLGSIVDSSRLKSAVSKELSISAENIIAMAIGRHSGDMIVLSEYTAVSGIPLAQLLSEEKIWSLITGIKDAGNLMAELSECPGTYYTPSAAAAEVIDSIHMDLKRILPVSIEFSGEYGISGVAMSLPCVIGKNGVEKVLTPVLTEAEHNALAKSADAIKEIIADYNE
jgi:malate dehydrogenase